MNLRGIVAVAVVVAVAAADVGSLLQFSQKVFDNKLRHFSNAKSTS